MSVQDNPSDEENHRLRVNYLKECFEFDVVAPKCLRIQLKIMEGENEWDRAVQFRWATIQSLVLQLTGKVKFDSPEEPEIDERGNELKSIIFNLSTPQSQEAFEHVFQIRLDKDFELNLTVTKGPSWEKS